MTFSKIKAKFFELPLATEAAVLTINLIIVFGLIGPSLISSNSTAAVWIGIAGLMVDAYVTWELSQKLREATKNV